MQCEALSKAYIVVTKNIYGGITMSVTISVRVPEDIKKQIEELGYTPSEYLRRILIKELKKEQSLRAVEWLKTHQLPAGEKSVEQEIREDRNLL